MLHWKVVHGRSKKLMPKNAIEKVSEVIERPKQLQLDGAKGSDAKPREAKGRKFR